jgi:hypothetical protein
VTHSIYIGQHKTVILHVGDGSVLFYRGEPLAVFDGATVFFPDYFYAKVESTASAREMTRAKMQQINEFLRNEPHVRVPPAEFQFQLGQTLVRYARPLTISAFRSGETPTEERPTNA